MSISLKCRCLLLLLAIIGFVIVIAGCDDNNSSPKYYWYVDSDGDGYGDIDSTPKIAEHQPAGYVTNYTDCDDTDPDVNPGEEENYSDDTDHDCDGCAYEVCCLTGERAVHSGSIIITSSEDLEKLKSYDMYYTTITGDLVINFTLFDSLTDKLQLQCLDTIEGDLIIQKNEELCPDEATTFASGLDIQGSQYISDNGANATCL